MRRRKHVELLLGKASQDEYVLERLVCDDQAPVEVFGFHAQQAAEKLLKAALVAVGRAYPRTHRLAELVDLLRAVAIDVPLEFDELRHLTPFAVEFRYDVVPGEDENPIDKDALLSSVRRLRQWVTGLLDQFEQEENKDRL